MSLIYDSFDLTKYAFVRLDRPIGPRMRMETEEVPGRAGDLVTSMVADTLTVTAHCTLRRRYLTSWERVRMELAAVFSAKGERVLQLPDETGMYRYATASLISDVSTPIVPPVTFDVEFVCHNPIAFGHERSVSLASGGSTSLYVDGTAPARIRISAPSAVRDASTQLWGLRFDDADFTRVKLPSSSPQKVEIDCAERTATIAGTTAMITKDSHWVELEPGSHTVRMELGTGTCVVSWTERYL